MKRQVLAVLLCGCVSALLAADPNLWVGGERGEWSNPANWSLGTPNKGSTIKFDTTTPVTVVLKENQDVATILVVANTPSVTFTGEGTKVTLNVHQDSKPGFYSPTTFDKDVLVNFSAGKVWYIYAPVRLLGGFNTAVKATNLFVQNKTTGSVELAGLVNCPNGVNLSGPMVWCADAQSSLKSISWGGGSFSVTDGPAHFDSSVVIASDLGLTLTGESPVAFSNLTGEAPALAIGQFKNTSFSLSRSNPVFVQDWFATCSESVNNNAKVGFLVHSAGHLYVPADVTTCANRAFDEKQEATNGGFALKFMGSGACIRLTGANTVQGGENISTAVVVDKSSGYNRVEIDGPGETISPFGVNRLATNSGAGLFIVPLASGKKMRGGLLLQQSVNNDGGLALAFDGTNDITVLDGVQSSCSGTASLGNIGHSTVTLDGPIEGAKGPIRLYGRGNFKLTPNAVYQGNNKGLVKVGAGTLTLASTFEGATNTVELYGGKTIFDYTENEASRLGHVDAGRTNLFMRSSDLVLKGGAFTESVSEGGYTKFMGGSSRVRRENGSSTINLGGVDFYPQSETTSVDFEAGVARTTTTPGTLFDGFVTVNGQSFAQVAEDGTIVAAPDNASGILSITGNKTSSREVSNNILIDTTAPEQTLQMNSATAPLVANKSGIIFRGDHNYTITGGQMGGPSVWPKPLVWTHAGEGTVTFDGELYRYGFVKKGPGTFIFKGKSSLANVLSVDEGIFEAASETAFSPSSSGSYAVCLNGGTLRTSVDVALDRPMRVGDNGGTLDVVEGTTFTLNAQIASAWDGMSGTLRKIGKGTWVLAGSAATTVGGAIELAEGLTRLDCPEGLGCSTNRTRAIAPIEITGGTLDINGQTAFLGNIVLKKGLITDNTGAGRLGAYTFFVEEGQIDATLTNTFRVGSTADKHMCNGLEKTTSGKVTLTAANEYTGTTLVTEGTLELLGSVAGPAWVSGGVLTGSGSVAGTTCIVENGQLAPSVGQRMTFSDQVVIGEGGTLVIDGETKANSIALTTPGKNLYLDEGARLEPHFKGKAGSFTIAELAEGGKVIGSFANFENGVYIDPTNKKYSLSTTGGDGNDLVLKTEIRGFYLIIR